MKLKIKSPSQFALQDRRELRSILHELKYTQAKVWKLKAQRQAIYDKYNYVSSKCLSWKEKSDG